MRHVRRESSRTRSGDDGWVGNADAAGSDYGRSAMRRGSRGLADPFESGFPAALRPSVTGVPPKRTTARRKGAKPRREWGQIKSTANEALARSAIRACSRTSRGALRTDGLPAFCETLGVASRGSIRLVWRVSVFDVDGIARRNALNCFAGPMAAAPGLADAAGGQPSAWPPSCATSIPPPVTCRPGPTRRSRTRTDQRGVFEMPVEEPTVFTRQ